MTRTPFALSLSKPVLSDAAGGVEGGLPSSFLKGREGLRQPRIQSGAERIWVLFCASLALLAFPADAQEFPRLTGRVMDQADLLTPFQEKQLTDQSEALEREIGPQYVIVTVTDLEGYPIEDYGIRLGNHWGIGSAERDDGVLLIVAPNERKVRIEVGYGLEDRITDPFAADVLQEHVLPHFREGHFPEGIIAGSAAIVEQLRATAGDSEMPGKDRIAV